MPLRFIYANAYGGGNYKIRMTTPNGSTNVDSSTTQMGPSLVLPYVSFSSMVLGQALIPARNKLSKLIGHGSIHTLLSLARRTFDTEVLA